MLTLLGDLVTDLAQVEHVMADTMHSEEPRVAKLLEDLGTYHGKMLRPSLLMLVARCLGPLRKEHHRLGAALELIHTATLIHDDMIDDGEVRRGTPTPHVRFGNSTAVLLGDYFYTRAFDLVAAQGDTWVTKTITATTNVICEGELHQMCARRDVDLTEEEYYKIIYAKTAVLCETACALGAYAGGADHRWAAAEFGRQCGMAFQIVDDCLDLVGEAEKVGKTLSTDIERGRLTLPFIKMLDAAGEEREALGHQLLSVQTPEDVAAVRSTVVKRGGVSAAMDTARDHVKRAQAALKRLPEGSDRQRLHDLAEFIVARDF